MRPFPRVTEENPPTLSHSALRGVRGSAIAHSRRFFADAGNSARPPALDR
jgi:hypothetical protein